MKNILIVNVIGGTQNENPMSPSRLWANCCKILPPIAYTLPSTSQKVPPVTNKSPALYLSTQRSGDTNVLRVSQDNTKKGKVIYR